MENISISDKSEFTLDLDFDTTFLCTYKLLEKDDLASECYQMQLLQAFMLTNYNDAIIQKKINNIYDFLRENEEFQNILSILSQKIFNFEILKDESLNNKSSIICFHHK